MSMYTVEQLRRITEAIHGHRNCQIWGINMLLSFTQFAILAVLPTQPLRQHCFSSNANWLCRWMCLSSCLTSDTWAPQKNLSICSLRDIYTASEAPGLRSSAPQPLHYGVEPISGQSHLLSRQLQAAHTECFRQLLCHVVSFHPHRMAKSAAFPSPSAVSRQGGSPLVSGFPVEAWALAISYGSIQSVLLLGGTRRPLVCLDRYSK